MHVSMYTGRSWQSSFKKPLKSDLPSPPHYQAGDTTHFSGKHKNATTSGVVARGGQSRLYTAANDARKDGFLHELEKTKHNPNESVAGDTTTLQALLENHIYYSQNTMEGAASTKEMLKSFLRHPQMKFLAPDANALNTLTAKVIHLNDREILNAFTEVKNFNIKELDENIQTQIWTGLGLV